ncbi:MAG TPA: metallophosphoesterase [Bacteroidales bacterium]|jgi:predicted MPP superfamily phosphohydrolase|nr:metallophosphoesterase [Bacteroidales bacterium]HQH23306.1 metallophosphoesterase [Bacteroidales bacterium]HQJ82210.1 metallophosphoesterase [Bacteroidales bacterium]
MNRINIRIIFWTILLYGLIGAQANAGKIIYPWRAVPAIVKCGNNFSILYDNERSILIDSVILEGPYNKIILNIDSVLIGKFEYDPYSHSSTNNEIWVTIPDSTPEELYDLIIKSGGEVQRSLKSVKVVKEFKPKHSFIHISDLHVSRQWVGTPVNGYAKELELLNGFLKVANIISPDFILVTGDNIHNYTRINADATGWGGTLITDAGSRPLVEEKWRNYFEGANNFLGINGFNSPVFSVTGNHDFYGVDENDHKAKVTQWNSLCGKRIYGFSYGETRVIAADDFMGDPVTDIPATSPMSGLQGRFFTSFFNQNGSGLLRIMAQHRHDRIDTSFCNKYKINILLHGHNHKPFVESVGITPTLSTRPGAVCRSGVLDTEAELGFFRLFYIDGDKFTYTEPLRFCKDPTKSYNELDLNLTIDFEKPNNGSSDKNKATLNNKLGVDLSDCNIRFIMKKGKYQVTKGFIFQVIETNIYSIVDVRANIPNGKLTDITISTLK